MCSVSTDLTEPLLADQRVALVGRMADDPWDVLAEPSMLSKLSPIEDVRGSAGYRKHAAQHLVRRALASLQRGVAA